jgi:hypothetical protein
MEYITTICSYSRGKQRNDYNNDLAVLNDSKTTSTITTYNVERVLLFSLLGVIFASSASFGGDEP